MRFDVLSAQITVKVLSDADSAQLKKLHTFNLPN
jgi:hypothetical protein